MLGQKRNDSLFGSGNRTIEAPQPVLEEQEAALEGAPLDEAVQPPSEAQTPATAFTDADDLPRRTIATEAAAGQRGNSPVNAGAKMEDLLDKAMQQNFVPVLDDNKSFIGIITRRDIMKYFSGSYKKTGNA